MHITELFLSAFSGINNNRKRAFLTMFGIIVGIASVITILCVGQGLKGAINDQFDELGVDQITLTNKTNDDGIIESEDILTLKDVSYLKGYKPLLAISPKQSISFVEAVDTLDKNKVKDINLIGVNEDYYKLFKDNKILYGRTISKRDVDNMSMVTVIPNGLSKEVFGTENSVGKKLTLKTSLGSIDFKVIGVKKDNNSELTKMFNVPIDIIVPISYTQMLKNNDDNLSSITFKVNSTNNMNVFGNSIIRLLQIKNGTNDAYKYTSIESEIDQINSILSIFTIFLTSVASISLLVGGVGVMNIMLVSVTERTKEIGIRKSLGATNANIKFQFLIESAILSGIGGVIGILLGLFTGFTLTSVASIIFNMEIIPSISILSVIVVITISCGIGILFGVYPAGKAAKLDPIESLRFD